MCKPNTFFVFSIFGSFTIIFTALSLPSLTSLTQKNHTASPFLVLNPSINTTTITTTNHQPNLTEFQAPYCEWVDYPVPRPRLDGRACFTVARALCASLATFGPEARNRWTWAESPNCALGYYFPDEAILPTQWGCEEVVFGWIIRTCAKPADPQGRRINAGTINVIMFPGGGRGDGLPMDEEAGRYIMLPRKL